MFDDVNSELDELTEKVNSMEKKSEDRIMELELVSVKCTEEFNSIKSIFESLNQRFQQTELNRQQTMEQMSLNMEEMRTKMTSMTQEMETLQFKKSEELDSLKAETYEWTIKDVAKNTLEENWRLISETFKFTGYKYEIRAKLEKKDGDIAISLQFQEGVTFNKFLNKNGFTTVKYIVKDQSDTLKKRHVIRETYLRFFDCTGQSGWILGYLLPGSVLSPPYVKNDCIKVTILLEPASIDRCFLSNNGVLKWRVDNYESRKDDQLYCIWSPSFYTSPRGYRVKTEFDINYKGSMFVAVVFLTGEHDDSLSIEFPHKTTVTLYNQLVPSKNLVKSDLHKDVKIYAIELESIAFIEENGFVKEDSLICSVVIEPVMSRLFAK